MKKSLLLISLLAFALMANATVINLSPGTGQIRTTVAAATTHAGDTIALAAGEYIENGNYTVLDKNIVIKAASSTKPVVKFNVPAQMYGGVKVEFKDIKFDMENSHSQSWYEHLISVEDYVMVGETKTATKVDGHILIFNGCEFYNDTLNNSVVFCSSTRKIDSVIVNDCKFHDIKKSCIFLENTDTKGIIVKNSSFYNISTKDGSYYAGIIDARTTAGKALVDHCTFYNCNAMNTDYGAIRFVSSDALVSNCIFSMPESTGSLRAIHMPNGREVKNCLVFNYQSDSKTGIRDGVTKTACISGKNPLFKNAAGGDFSLYAASPARGAATDASNLGDPRWAAALTPVAIPATLVPYDALLSENASIIMGTPDSIYLKTESKTIIEWAKWKISVTENGLYEFKAYAKRTDSDGSQRLEILVLNNDESETLKSKSETGLPNECTISTGGVNLVAGNTYVVKVRNTYDWARTKLIKVEALYAGGKIIAVPDTLWPVDAIRSELAYVEDDSLHFTDPSHEGQIREQWAKWNVSIAEAGKYKFTVNANSSNGQNYRITLKNADESSTIGTWYGEDNDSGERKVYTEILDLSVANYVLVVQDTVKWSKGRVANVLASYEGGKTVTVPGQILAKEAIIGKVDGGHTPKMSHIIGSGDLKYDNFGYPLEEFATWTINATQAGEMEVTLNVSKSGHIFSVVLYQGDTRLDSIGEIWEGDEKTIWKGGDITLPDHLTFPEAGTYTLKLLNRQAHSSGALHGITFTEYTPSITLDENETDVNAVIGAYDGRTVDATLTRTLSWGKYNTICLPFDVSAAQVTSIFGTDRVSEITNMSIADGTLTLMLAPVATMEAGKPYFVQPEAADIVNPTFTGVTIDKTVRDYETTDIHLHGTFVKTQIPANNDNLFLSGNDLYYPEGSPMPIKGMRAWFVLQEGVVMKYGALRRASFIDPARIPTDIEIISTADNSKVQKVLRNGQLIIVRDGVEYNAMGQTVK